MPAVGARPAAVPRAYLAVWTLVGIAIYALYRPHGLFRRPRGSDRGRYLRVHAAPAALPPTLPRERPLWIRVRALLRRPEVFG